MITAAKLKSWLRRILVAALGASALTYGTDYAIFHVRVAANWNAYGSVTVNHTTATLQKNGKTNYIFDPPAPQTCVNALFPHVGLSPCWYLSRHPDQVTNI